MQRLTAALLIALALLGGCSKDPDPAPPAEFHVSLTEPEPSHESALADGDAVEVAANAESRDAILVILEGIPAPAVDEPLKYGLVRAIDAPMFRDVDDGEGPEQWITIAEVQDDEGNVLWTDRVNTLFQLLEFLSVILEQQSDLNFGITQVFGFVYMQYPSLLEFGVRVPTGIDGGTQYVLRVPKADGEYYEAFRADIDELVAGAVAPTTGQAQTIVENGDPAEKFDIVILGDGYTADQRERFEDDAAAIADRIARNEPFATKMSEINIHTVWTPSVEAGAGYDCTGIITADNGCKRDLRDTVYQTVFVLTALADRLNIDLQDTSDRVAMPLQVASLFENGAAVPFDEIVMVSNTRRSSGFAGLYVSILTAYDGRIGFPDTAVHELGHSFGVLGDEYNVEGDPCLLNEPRIPLPPNISTTASADDLKWAHLVEEGTPLPTDLSDVEDELEVGAFAGAYNCEQLYRPAHNCKMRDSDSTFCAVCSEQLVRRLYAFYDPFALGSTATATREGQELVFRVRPHDDTVGVQWLLGETEVGTGPELRLGPDAIPETWSALRARVHDASPFVVADLPETQQSAQFWIRR